MDEAEAQAMIAQLPLFSMIGDEAKKGVAKVFLSVSDRILYADGEALINEGYLSFDTGYVLIEGTVAVESTTAEGDPIEITAPALLGEMSQFRAGDMRSATVRAKGEARAIQFFWDDLYAHADETLPEKDHLAFRMAIERQVWERFSYRNITTLGMFSDLKEEIRVEVCLPFPSITERMSIKGVDTLFSQGTRCNFQGFLVVDGSIKVFRQEKGEKTVKAPDMVGIFPSPSDKEAIWSATGMANGEAEVLKFNWEFYTEQLMKRLSREDLNALIKSIGNNKAKHFWH